MIQDSKFKIQDLNKGFSLVETLVAITILLIAIAGPLTVANRALVDSRIAKNQTAAIFLAQDAMEYILHIKDSNVLASKNWLTDIGSCAPPAKCTVDTVDSTPGVIHNVCGVGCPFLRFDSVNGLYGYNATWDETDFLRTVTVTSILADEATVSVDISWGSGIRARSLSLKRNIYDWQE
jgi:prepilin-type N-terminal cleavage/methylation domain-containing protein